MEKRNAPKLVIPLVILFLGVSLYAEVKIGVHGGANQLFGPQFNAYNLGFSMGGNVFAGISENSYLGLRITYNNFPPDDDEILESLVGLQNGDVDGFAWSIDIVPVLRFSTGWDFPINIFTEAGAGVSVINSELTITGTINGVPVNTTTGFDTQINFISNASLGVTIGLGNAFSIDAFPTFNAIFLDWDDLWVYGTFNLGFSYAF